MSFNKWAGRICLALILLSPVAKALADSGNPFDATTTLITDWTGRAKTMIIAFASLAGVIVIGLGIAGILKIKWAVQIIVGLIALTGLAWLVASAQGQGG